MDDFEKSLRTTFLDEADHLLDENEQQFLSLEASGVSASAIDAIFRLVHSIKGSAGAAGFNDIAKLAHELESLLMKLKSGVIPGTREIIDLLLRCNDCLVSLVQDYKKYGSTEIDIGVLMGDITKAAVEMPEGDLEAPRKTAEEHSSGFQLFTYESRPSSPNEEYKAKTAGNPSVHSPKIDESIRVALPKLDRIISSIGELVILQSFLSQHKNEITNPLLLRTIDQSEKTCKEVQGLSMSLRMLPVGPVFQKMQRIVRDTANSIQKEVHFIHSGDDTELDKTILEKIGDPLVHLVRNAIDHGIESPEERQASGKEPQGKIMLTASHSGSHVVIEIADDGKGLDPVRLVANAKEKGIIPQDASLSAEEAYDLIFLPGFSTKSCVTDISGRGVGMDVVKTNITDLKGEIEVETILGQGTTFRILLPLTLAIVDALIVNEDERRFVIPLATVEEIVPIKMESIETALNKQDLINIRGRAMPIFRLTQLLGIRRTGPIVWPSIAMITNSESGSNFAVMVDDIVSQQQIMVKNPERDIEGVPGVIGTTILGDGRPSLILDFSDMIAKSGIRIQPATQKMSKEAVG
ncbi:chemotaxis protein CheA [Oligoflexus tunisiensis]|uniref:chemotaxis protein CheA n=1 Tax=Oligoflexus tunisiensis TaxID=708132 RepID=UPI000B0E6D3D|nr:chemotaxis protein CheA [Oligoflexus tunisiensis]